MSDEELWTALDSFCAYEMGILDDGAPDPMKKLSVVEQLKSMSATNINLFVSRNLRDQYLSEESLSEGYGVEDVVEFWEWFERFIT